MPGARPFTAAKATGAGATHWEKGLPHLLGPGLALREPCVSDTPSLAALIGPDTAWRFTCSTPADACGFADFINWARAERLAGRGMCFGIVPGGAADAVGLILVRRLELDFRIAEFAFVVSDPFWPTGLVATAATLVTDFVFRHIGVHRLEIRTTTGREDSVARRLGAVREGLLRGSWRTDDRFGDQELWSILNEEWLAACPAPRYACEPTLSREPEGAANDGIDAVHLHAAPPWGDTLPVLRRAGVTLREIEARDAAALHEALAPEDLQVSIEPTPASVDMFRQYIGWAREQCRMGRAACFVVLPDGSADPAGLVQVRQLDPRFTTAEWGFVLAPAYHGTGLFADVARLTLTFAFDTIGVRRLEARTAGTNLPASHAMRKAGATHEACLRSSFLHGGQYVDDNLWAILADDWRRKTD